ncbi:type 1 glutamine amidotransferase domain-containing protein [Pseudoxanthomonas indica]|uniref:Putative intracellular protease/amidase n=1 Tax=Pseudoxanthomonas indica TaxID=428993 RepID=A0A1T5JX09_9GAMM|nr:type 1 glutamine amidotransferase domain-containing protein [Pseudoxanthomonas indica]GGD45070.1 peptidase [Pseudoxanthomonas indica]SKC55951.1 Putative intracellular protease/amidase [Pseudoxanthomonas indica]
MKKILMVLTSHDKLGDTGKKTGFWLEEFAAPYYAFKDAGAEVVLASPLGGQPPLDPKSDAPDAQTPATVRFNGDTEAIAALAQTRKLAEVVDADVDAVFYPGGHGPLWDLVDDADSLRLIETKFAAGKPVAAVCHGPAVLRNAKGALSQPLVKDKRVTGFSNEEEAAAQLTDVVPFLLEDALKAQGAHYEAGAAFQPHVVVDGRLVTGQNPASSEPAAQAVLKLLG